MRLTEALYFYNEDGLIKLDYKYTHFEPSSEDRENRREYRKKFKIRKTRELKTREKEQKGQMFDIFG